MAAEIERDPYRPVQLALFGNGGNGVAPQVLGRERGRRRRVSEVSDDALEAEYGLRGS